MSEPEIAPRRWTLERAGESQGAVSFGAVPLAALGALAKVKLP